MNDYFTGVTTSQRYEIEKVLGQGGQGTVTCVKDDGQKRFAAKWYKSATTTEEQRARLQQLVRKGIPKSVVQGVHFIWPIEMITYPSAPNGIGYLMPLIDTKRFYTLNQIIRGKITQPRQPRLSVLARISYLIAQALDAIHAAGLAYCDINLGNIMIDPVKGEVVICDNDNVVINNSPVGVKGVWEFMAPEVALSQSHPTAETDQYSFAVLIYHLWMWEHPMEGKKTLSLYSWDIPAKIQYFAKEPTFVFHPDDSSNCDDGIRELQTSVQRWNRMTPPALREAFTRLFTEGVHNPSQRIQLVDWQRMFIELQANAVKCTQCGAETLWDGVSTGISCFHCKSSLPLILCLKTKHGPGTESVLLAQAGATLNQHHLDVTRFRHDAYDRVATIEPHPKQPGAVIFRNQIKQPFDYVLSDGTRYTIEPGQARALLPDSEITLGNNVFRVARIQ